MNAEWQITSPTEKIQKFLSEKNVNHLQRTTKRCPVKNCSSLYQQDIVSHFRKYHIPVFKVFLCTDCYHTASDSQSLRQHYIQEHCYEGEEEEYLPATMQSSLVFQILINEEHYIDPGIYRMKELEEDHVESNLDVGPVVEHSPVYKLDQNLVCPVKCCGFVCRVKTLYEKHSCIARFRDHWQNCHTNVTASYVCLQCDQSTFSSQRQLNAHIEKIHSNIDPEVSGLPVLREIRDTIKENSKFIEPGDAQLPWKSLVPVDDLKGRSEMVPLPSVNDKSHSATKQKAFESSLVVPEASDSIPATPEVMCLPGGSSDSQVASKRKAVDPSPAMPTPVKVAKMGAGMEKAQQKGKDKNCQVQ